MSRLATSTADVNCRYLAAPESSTSSEFGRHLHALGIKLPFNLSIRTMVARGWLKPRLRVAVPVAALQSWTTFPSHPITGDEACPPECVWGLESWTAATCSWSEPDRPATKLWMHWLDDLDDNTTVNARKHVLDPVRDPEPASFVHPYCGQTVLPWIDFFADWQAYHVAELVKMTQFTVLGVTDSFGSCAAHVEHHTTRFDERAKALAQRWEGRSAFLDHLACYRTILGHCSTRDTFSRDTQLGARLWAEAKGVGADAIRTGVCEVLLRLWQHWEDSPPAHSPRLMHRLQQDIQYAVRLLLNLTDEPVDPFAPIWYWRHFSRGDWAQLVDALPYEEWLARRDFAKSAVHYQRGSHPFLLGADQMTDALTNHWPVCPPLRRFCLAWVRLHEEMRSRDRDLPADLTIAANERIEQFNLIALNTERVLRHVGSALHPPESGEKQPGIGPLMHSAVHRAVNAANARFAQVASVRAHDLLADTKLHDMPAVDDVILTPSDVNCGSAAVDEIIAAHVNALIARNYAAHHDYLDEELIYPSRDGGRPHAGFVLLSSCLLVVVAALHSLPAHKPVAKL